MALTNKLQNIADCYPDPEGEPDLNAREYSNEKLFEWIINSGKFPINGARLLDIGSGMYGSEFVNRYRKDFPGTKTIFLDSSKFLLDKLDSPNNICADGIQMPFPDETFDLEYAGHIISAGVIKNHFHLNDESYNITKESYRVLKRGGLFVFTYVMGDEAQTLINLSEIGFKNLEHLQRIKWYGGIPTDTYAAIK